MIMIFFLTFIGTSGGRLARWLQPESFIDVDQCEVHISSDDLKCNWPTIISIVTHDQYGDIVQVPDLKVSSDSLCSRNFQNVKLRLDFVEI